MDQSKIDEIGRYFEKAADDTKSGHIEKAIESYKKIIALAGSNKRVLHLAYWGIGEIYLNNKAYEKAEQYLSKAIKSDPGVSYYHYLLGCTYTYMERIDEAIPELEKAIELDNSLSIYWDQLGWVVGYNKDTEKGIEYLKKALSIDPTNSRALRDICMLYAENSRLKEAIVSIEEAEKHDPNNEQIAEMKMVLKGFEERASRGER